MTPVVVIAIDARRTKAEGNLRQREPERGMRIGHTATFSSKLQPPNVFSETPFSNVSVAPE